MSIKQIIDIIANDSSSWLVIIIIAISIVQIAPIKLNPWTSMFNWISRILTKPLVQKIDGIDSKIKEVNTNVENIDKRLTEHIKESDTESLQRIRQSILSFGSSIISGKNYHKEQFDFMISECDRYETYCKERNIVNGVADATIKEIRRVYSLKLSEDSFLKEHIGK